MNALLSILYRKSIELTIVIVNCQYAPIKIFISELCMNVLLSILYRKSVELTIKSMLLLIAYKNVSCLNSHLLVLLFVKLLPAMRVTNASKPNTFNSR